MPRSGATLTEVLIALAVMSIGLVSVMSIFPVSLGRSLAAAQLTKGTDLRYNAESSIHMYPKMITNPGQVATPLTTEFFAIDPMQAALLPAGSPYLGSFGNVYRNTNGSQDTIPMAFTGGSQINTGGSINRYSYVPVNTTAADYLVTFPDTWVPVHEGTASNPQGTNGYTRIDVAGVGTGGAASALSVKSGTYRAVIFNTDGTKTLIRRITNFTGTTVLWTEDTDLSGGLNGTEDANKNGVLDEYPLPGTIGASPTFVPSRVRIDQEERRYTWMLTVRRINGKANVDAVIFFGRALQNPRDDEAVYPSRNFVTGQRYFTVDYTNFSEAPPAKRGGYAFDVNNCRWYRITSTVDNPNNSSNSKTMTVGLESPAIVGQPNNGGYVIFPKGVVDVYPLGEKP